VSAVSSSPHPLLLVSPHSHFALVKYVRRFKLTSKSAENYSVVDDDNDDDALSTAAKATREIPSHHVTYRPCPHLAQTSSNLPPINHPLTLSPLPSPSLRTHLNLGTSPPKQEGAMPSHTSPASHPNTSVQAVNNATHDPRRVVSHTRATTRLGGEATHDPAQGLIGPLESHPLSIGSRCTTGCRGGVCGTVGRGC